MRDTYIEYRVTAQIINDLASQLNLSACALLVLLCKAQNGSPQILSANKEFSALIGG
jgi:hypothetical protein